MSWIDDLFDAMFRDLWFFPRSQTCRINQDEQGESLVKLDDQGAQWSDYDKSGPYSCI